MVRWNPGEFSAESSIAYPVLGFEAAPRWVVRFFQRVAKTPAGEKAKGERREGCTRIARIRFKAMLRL